MTFAYDVVMLLLFSLKYKRERGRILYCRPLTIGAGSWATQMFLRLKVDKGFARRAEAFAWEILVLAKLEVADEWDKAGLKSFEVSGVGEYSSGRTWYVIWEIVLFVLIKADCRGLLALTIPLLWKAVLALYILNLLKC
jgi:hypothetical protein